MVKVWGLEVEALGSGFRVGGGGGGGAKAEGPRTRRADASKL